MTYTIELERVSKSYTGRPVLDALDMAVPAGTVFALLGPNGAGKTTIVRILATLLSADAGTARVAGHDVVTERAEVRRRIGLTGQTVALDELLSGEQNLTTAGRLRGLSAAAARRRSGELLASFGLTAAARRPVATYSGGMRRRLDLAAGLVCEPEVLFLDEPSTGLDPRSRQSLWDEIAEIAGRGVTVLLTTQYLEEADRLADEVAVLDHGRIVARGTPDELKQRVAGRLLAIELVDRAAVEAAMRVLVDRVTGAEAAGLTITVPTDGGAAGIRGVLDAIDPDGVAVRRFSVRTATLDDVFLAVTGHTTEQPNPRGAIADV